MAGDHACPVCAARFTRPQHVTRHMRSHTGDRPYKCTQCGDQFARSDLLSRHVNKCHNGAGASTTGRGNKRTTHATANTTATSNALPQSADPPCDQCLQNRQQCDLGSPCGKCVFRKAQCTNAAKSARAGGSVSERRVSLPSISQQQQQQPQSLAYAPQQGPPQQPFNGQLPGIASQQFDLGLFSFGQDRSSSMASTLPALRPAQPVPMPNGQYIDDDNYPLFAPNDRDLGLRTLNGLHQLPNGLGGPLPRLGSLPYPNQSQGGQQYNHHHQPQQQYQFGADPSNALPPLTMGDAYSTDPKAAAAAYLQQRRGSLQNPRTHHRVYSTGSEPYHTSPQLQYQQTAPYPPPTYNPSYQQQGSPVSLNGQFDGKRTNERLAVARAFNSNDDASSVSDLGSNSGAPSPVPSSHSIPYSASSRPTSSAGSARDGQPASGNESLVSSLQGAIPLPTPLQLHSFNTFPDSQAGTSDRIHGISGGPSAGKPGAPYPPYQSFEHMNLDEVASFAAAARNASNAYSYGGPTNATQGDPNYQYPPGQQLPITMSQQQQQQPPLSAGGKEKAINELKEFWSAFISEPLTGGGGGSGTVTANISGGNGNGHVLAKQQSMPSLKTPLPMSSERSGILAMEMNHPTPRVLYPNGHHSIRGLMFNPELGSGSTPTNHTKLPKMDFNGYGSQVKQSDQQSIAAPPEPEDAENLRSYQEACLKRETPMLRLGPRPKSRLVSSTSPQNKGGIPPLPNTGDVDMKPSDVMPTKSDAVRFAAPFPPGSKEARDWNHCRAQAAATADPHQPTGSRSMSMATDPSSVAARPSYKRSPSQTLGPDYSKKSRDGAVANSHGDGEGSDGEGNFHVSYPQSEYTGAAQGAPGSAHGTWMRQRSMSSPSGMRPNDVR